MSGKAAQCPKEKKKFKELGKPGGVLLKTMFF